VPAVHDSLAPSLGGLVGAPLRGVRGRSCHKIKLSPLLPILPSVLPSVLEQVGRVTQLQAGWLRDEAALLGGEEGFLGVFEKVGEFRDGVDEFVDVLDAVLVVVGLLLVLFDVEVAELVGGGGSGGVVGREWLVLLEGAVLEGV